MRRRTLGKMAVGACGPVALTALWGTPPAQAANPNNGSVLSCTVSSYAPGPTSTGITGRGRMACTAASEVMLDVRVQKQAADGSWVTTSSQTRSAHGTTLDVSSRPTACSGSTPFTWITTVTGTVFVETSGGVWRASTTVYSDKRVISC